MPVLVRRYLLSAGVYRCIDVLGVSVYLVTKLALSSSQTKPMLGLIRRYSLSVGVFVEPVTKLTLSRNRSVD